MVREQIKLAADLGAPIEIVIFEGHTGYELCSPVIIGHRHAGLEYALLRAQLACEYMRRIIDSL